MLIPVWVDVELGDTLATSVPVLLIVVNISKVNVVDFVPVNSALDVGVGDFVELASEGDTVLVNNKLDVSVVVCVLVDTILCVTDIGCVPVDGKLDVSEVVGVCVLKDDFDGVTVEIWFEGVVVGDVVEAVLRVGVDVCVWVVVMLFVCVGVMVQRGPDQSPLH